jgi:hypothetical protein
LVSGAGQSVHLLLIEPCGVGLEGLEFRDAAPDLVEVSPKFVEALVRGEGLSGGFGAGLRLAERLVQFLAERRPARWRRGGRRF